MAGCYQFDYLVMFDFTPPFLQRKGRGGRRWRKAQSAVHRGAALLLTSASSVNTFLKALEDKEMITRDGNKWIVYDVFFSRWLEYNYKK